MKTLIFLPRKFYVIGLAISLVGIIGGLFRALHYRRVNDPYDWLAGSITIIGLLILNFTKEEIEDEFINQLRLKAFLLATLFTGIYVATFNIIAFVFDFIIPASASTAVTFSQAFYSCYFLWLKKKYQFHSKDAKN